MSKIRNTHCQPSPLVVPYNSNSVVSIVLGDIAFSVSAHFWDFFIIHNDLWNPWCLWLFTQTTLRLLRCSRIETSWCPLLFMFPLFHAEAIWFELKFDNNTCKTRKANGFLACVDLLFLTIMFFPWVTKLHWFWAMSGNMLGTTCRTNKLL